MNLKKLYEKKRQRVLPFAAFIVRPLIARESPIRNRVSVGWNPTGRTTLACRWFSS